MTGNEGSLRWLVPRMIVPDTTGLATVMASPTEAFGARPT